MKLQQLQARITGRRVTTTEQAFGLSHLSRLPLDPEPKSALVPGPTAIKVRRLFLSSFISCVAQFLLFREIEKWEV